MKTCISIMEHLVCLRELPMRCVACHGGDPTATTQETAHYDRSAHPIFNEDILQVPRNAMWMKTSVVNA